MEKIYLEFKDDKSSKFWSVEWDQNSYTVTYGKIGSNGTSKTTECQNPDVEAKKQAAAKIKKGYIEIKDSTPAQTSTKPSPKPIVWDKEECVSIWFTNFEGIYIPDDYLEFVYPDVDEEEEFDPNSLFEEDGYEFSSSIFTREFDMDWFDEDFTEYFTVDEPTNDYASLISIDEYGELSEEQIEEFTKHLNGQKFTGAIILGNTYCEHIKHKNADGTVFFVGSLNFSDDDLDEYEEVIDEYEDAKYCEEKIFTSSTTIVKANAFANNTNLKRVVLSDSITSIDREAFSECSNLEEIVLSKNLKSIRAIAFKGCKNLKRIILNDTKLENLVEFPETLEIIEPAAFFQCDSLVEVNIPSLVHEIGGMAFGACNSLIKVTLPKNLTKINDGLVQECSNLEEVFIPESVTYIGGHAFNQCVSLKKIDLPKNLTFIGPTAFQSCESIKEINIPNGITSLPQFCFHTCKSLEKVTLSKNITSFDRSVFSVCESLESIVLPDGLEEMGVYCFERCKNLKEITLPKNLVSIPDSTFSNCSNLKEITLPKSVKKIGKYSFNRCTNLKQVTLSNGLEEITDYSFSNCSNLKEVILPKSLKKLGNYSFNRCTSLKEMILPEQLEKTGEFVFNRCTNLEKVTFTSDIKVIAEGLFNYCEGLKTVVLSKNVKIIDKFCFNHCHTIEKVEINSDLEKVEYASFQDCYELKEIILPDSVSKIEDYAFTGCRSLVINEFPKSLNTLGKYSFSRIKNEKVIVGENITEIHSQAFRECGSLKEFVVSDKNKKYETKDGVLYTKGLKCLVIYPNGKEAESFVVPDEVDTIEYQSLLGCKTIKKFTFSSNVKTIPGWMFEACSNLTEVVIPNGVKTISKGAFRLCSGLKEINLPDSIEVLEEFCICDCEGIEYLKIPKNVKEIGKNLLWGNENLSKLEVDPKNKWFVSIDNVVYNFDKTEIYTLAPNLKVETFNVLEGIKIVKEGSIAHNKHIKTVNFPASMTSFEVNGIHMCASIESVSVDAANEVYSSADGNLFSKDKTKFFYYPIGNKRTEFTIPKHIKSLESDCFFQAKNLTNIVIPSSVKHIKQYAFQACTGLKEIYIPDTVLSIGSKAFTQVSEDLVIYLNTDRKCDIHSEFNPLDCEVKSYNYVKEEIEDDNCDDNNFAGYDKNVHLELKQNGKHEFWKAYWEDEDSEEFVIHYGEIGSEGVTETIEIESDIRDDLSCMISSKIEEGYRKVNRSIVSAGSWDINEIKRSLNPLCKICAILFDYNDYYQFEKTNGVLSYKYSNGGGDEYELVIKGNKAILRDFDHENVFSQEANDSAFVFDFEYLVYSGADEELLKELNTEYLTYGMWTDNGIDWYENEVFEEDFDEEYFDEDEYGLSYLFDTPDRDTAVDDIFGDYFEWDLPDEVLDIIYKDKPITKSEVIKIINILSDEDEEIEMDMISLDKVDEVVELLAGMYEDSSVSNDEESTVEKSSNSIYLEFKDEKSSKFWKVEWNEDSYIVTYGKIGANGTAKITESSNPEADARKQANAKIKKGYKESLQAAKKTEAYEMEGAVSIWFTNFPKESDAFNYCEFDYNDKDSDGLPQSQLTKDFDLTYYDEDFAEIGTESSTNDYESLFAGCEYEDLLSENLSKLTRHLNGKEFTGIIIVGEFYCENVKLKNAEGTVFFGGSLIGDDEDYDY